MSLCQHTSGEVSSSARVDKDTQGEEIQENILCLSGLNWMISINKNQQHFVSINQHTL